MSSDRVFSSVVIALLSGAGLIAAAGCEEPGTIVGTNPKGLQIAAGGGTVYLQDVQLESKKRMPITEFLRGFRFVPGKRLG